MNSKAPREEFHVDIDKAIDQFSNMSKCLDKKWNMYCEMRCDNKCDECDYMYGFGNSGQIENLFENVQEWLKELKMLRDKEQCKIGYIEGYNKAVDDVLEKLNIHYDKVAQKTKYPQYDNYCNGVEDCIDMLEQLKGDRKNDD